ncbi:MAG: hypothetical protein GC131_07115 [Alphaproteobacteria bacterium]|nr:hypothetical protein [Alphaproteobacteria bacterium]
MAKAKGKAPAAAAAGATGTKKKGSGPVGLIMLVCVMLAILAPSACIIIPGMLPALVCLISDRDKEKAAGITVSAMNAAGVAPLVIELWKMGHSFDSAFTILGQPLNWLIMYGAAGVGWAIYATVPAMIASLMSVHAESRIKILKANQETVKKIWGADVGGEQNNG